MLVEVQVYTVVDAANLGYRLLIAKCSPMI